MNSSKPRVHIFQDMDNQARFKTQQVNDLFADRRADRPDVSGTVARGEAKTDDHLWRGWVDGDWATGFPADLTVDMTFVQRGRERFAIYCTPCHGGAGYGDGMIHQRAMELMANPVISNGTNWVPPGNLHAEAVRIQPVGQIYNSITNGIRNMRGYAAQIPVEDRWAITAYVKALQRSQTAQPGDVDADLDDLPLYDLRPPTEEAAEGASAAAGVAAPNGDAS